jgi:hypothetical protein
LEDTSTPMEDTRHLANLDLHKYDEVMADILTLIFYVQLYTSALRGHFCPHSQPP